MSRDHLTTADGVHWTILPESRELLGPDGPALDRWLAAGQADIVKHGPHRTVYRVNLPRLCLYWKHCRLLGIRGWLRQLLRPPKARMEFDHARRLQAMQVPTIEAIAWGQRGRIWPSESVLITRNREDTQPLRDLLEETLPKLPRADQAPLRRTIAHELGLFLAKLHQGGIIHPDLHPGNLLVELTPDGMPKFYLLDLHAIRLTGPLDWPAARANLVLFHRYFQLRASRSDRARFWHSYRHHRADWSQDDALVHAQARELELATAVSNRRFWRSRQSRCIESNRYFQKVQSPASRGFGVRDIDAEFLRSLAHDPDAPFLNAMNRRLKDGVSSTVIEMIMPSPIGDRAVILKRFNASDRIDGIKNLLRPSPAMRSWIAGNDLITRGLPTARPLVVLHRQKFGMPTVGYLLCEKIPDCVELQDAVPVNDPSALRQRIEMLGQLLARMHERNLGHRDLKAANLLVDSTGAMWFIDLVGVECDITPTRERRLRDLSRLAVSFARDPRIRNTDRLRLLRAYFAWGLQGRDDWKSAWRTIALRVQMKIERNQRVGRVIA